MYCIHCGVQNPDNANFKANYCSNCGKEIAETRTDKPQPQVHHPWMSEQPTSEARQNVQPEPPEPPQSQDKGEAPALVKRIQGWSVKKKILWGIVAGFLFLVCVGVAVAEPVDEEAVAVSSTEGEPVPTLGVSFNDIKSELEDEWKFDFESADKSNGISEIRGESEDILATILIREAENGITEFDARMSIEGIRGENAAAMITASMLFFGDMTGLVLPDWDGRAAFGKAISDSISNRDTVTETMHDSGRITFEIKLFNELVLTITADE